MSTPDRTETTTRAWRHKKRGTLYTELGRAELQNAWDAPLADGSELVIYRGEDRNYVASTPSERMLACDRNRL